MRNFRSDDRGEKAGFRGNRSNGSSRGFGRGREERRGGFRDRDSGSSGRRLEMHEVTCDKCGKQCEVPFKPTGDKPVFCSDCFRNEGGSSSSSSSSNRNSRPSSFGASSGAGISQEQYKELNTKLDKILGILEQIEFEEVDEDEESEDDEDEAEEVA